MLINPFNQITGNTTVNDRIVFVCNEVYIRSFHNFDIASAAKQSVTLEHKTNSLLRRSNQSAKTNFPMLLAKTGFSSHRLRERSEAISDFGTQN